MVGSLGTFRRKNRGSNPNDALRRIEDDIRDCERQGEFGARFVALTRSVYRINDRRAQLRRQSNELSGSPIAEEKSYNDY